MGGNGDLYWTIYNRNSNIVDHESFTITKENSYLYSLFENLFYDIENVNIYEKDELDDFLPFSNNEEDKESYIKYNRSHYNDLYDSDNKVITWYSDETNSLVANYLQINKEDDIFKIDFNIQEHHEGYDKDFSTSSYITIRFRNSGSNYDPFNIIFMRMYTNMKDLDDIFDPLHQITIDEYLYSKNKQLVRKK